MPTAILPAYAKIQEQRIAVSTQIDAVRRPLNLKNPVGPRHTEIWRGEISFAAMTRADIHAFGAWLAALDGRVEAFALPFINGFSSLGPTQAGALVGNVAYGAETITVSGLGAAPLVGTIGKIGADIDSGPYWLFQIVSVTPSGGNYVLEWAPRARAAISAGATVNLGAVNGKFKLDTDRLDSWQSNVSHGIVSIPVVEAL